MAETSTLNGTMKPIPYLLLAALALPLGACSMAPSFDVRVVDSATGAPIGGTTVGRLTTHFRWPKRWDDTSAYLGETDENGMLNVEKLNMSSKTHRLGFRKNGYGLVLLFVLAPNGKVSYSLTRSGHGDVVHLAPLSGSRIVEIPMWKQKY